MKRQIGLIMDRHPVFSTALIARRCFASKSASNEYHFGRPGIPVTLRELEEKMMRDVSTEEHFKHMAKVMVDRMVSSVKGEFNSEAKTVKTEVEKMLKSEEEKTETKSETKASSSSVNNTTARKKRGSNKENNATSGGDKTDTSVSATAESKQPVNAKSGQPQKTRGRRGNAAKKTEAVETEVKTEVEAEVKAEVNAEVKAEVKTEVKNDVKPATAKAKKTAAAEKSAPVPAKKAKKSEPIAESEQPPPPPKKATARGRRGNAAAKKTEVKAEEKPEVSPEVKTEIKTEVEPTAAAAKKAAAAAKKAEKSTAKKRGQQNENVPSSGGVATDDKDAKSSSTSTIVVAAEAPAKPKTASAAEIIEKVTAKPSGAGRKRKNATALAPVNSNRAAKVQKTLSPVAPGVAKVVTAASAASAGVAAKIIQGSPGSPAKIAITGNNLISLSSLTQPLPPQVVLPTTPVSATQVQSVKSTAPCPPQVIQLRPAGAVGSAAGGGSSMQIRPLRAAGVVGGTGPRPQFFKIVGGKPVQISNLQRLPAGTALQQAPAGSRVVYMRAPGPGSAAGGASGAQATSAVATSSVVTATATTAAASAATAAAPQVATSSTGNKIILLSNKGQAIPVSGKGGVGGGPSIVRIVSPNSLTTTSGGKLALAPNSPTKVLRPATGATGPILLRTVAPRPTSTAAPPIQLPMAPLPKSALTNNPTTAAVTVTSDGKAKIVSQNDTTAKAIQVLLPKSPLPPTNSNIVASSTAPAAVTAAPVSPQKSPGGGITTTTTTTTASGAFVWTNSTRANFKLSSRINFASLDKFKNVVNKDVHFILASIVTEDKSNEFSFRLHLKREPIGGGAASKAKKAAATAGEPQQSYLELEGKAKVPTAQEWSLKVKTEPPVFLVSKGNFLADFPAVRIPKEIAEKPFVDYELHIDKCSPMQVATTAGSGTTASTTAAAASSPTPKTTTGALPAKRSRKPKIQS